MTRLRATFGMTALWMALTTVACSSGDDGGTDPSTETDGGSDGATDSMVPDTEAPDTEKPDTGTPDTDTPDTDTPDTEIPDAAGDETGTSGDDSGSADTAHDDGSTPDSSTEDTGTSGDDSGSADTAHDDGSTPDSSTEDTGTPDDGDLPDSTTEDTEAPDTSIEDGSADTAIEDGSADTAVEDTDTSETAVPDSGSDAPETFYPPPDYVGSACGDDGDCYPGQSCSNGIYWVGAVDPTPVCMEVPSSCTPSDESELRYCDGDVGMCVSESGTAICVPMCMFDQYGHMHRGCTGKNACNLDSFATDGVTLFGIGRCTGGCTSDADCPAGNKCDPVMRQCHFACTDDAHCKDAWDGAPSIWACDESRGVCTFEYPKALGDVCTSSNDCACLKSASAASGYCTQVCTTGVSGECPAGFTCDAFLPATYYAGTAFTTTPPGLSAFCAKNCTTDADCPANTVCMASAGMTQKTCFPW